ncbi:MAG: hypothetical protein WCC87_03600 [Candidatus Korobacteraceae bacterium]
MQRTISQVIVFLILMTAAMSAVAQSTPATQGSSSPASAKPPDMVCFGYGPKWSVQFISGEARYLGINQPDQTFLGDFYWVPEDKAWEWHRANGLAPMSGSFGLSATIQKASCADPVRKQTYPYSSQVNLPSGDMVSGCCRKLRPGEAPVGRHGLQQMTPPSGSGQSATPGAATPQSPKAQPQ